MVRGHYSEVCHWLCACTLCVCLIVVVHVCLYMIVNVCVLGWRQAANMARPSGALRRYDSVVCWRLWYVDTTVIEVCRWLCALCVCFMVVVHVC